MSEPAPDPSAPGDYVFRRLEPGDAAGVARLIELVYGHTYYPRELYEPREIVRLNAAGRLIETCGLKGFTVGQARVSPVHANFIVNLGKATAADVLAVGDHCRACVKARFGIELEYEVQRIGRWDAEETGAS